LAYVTGADKSAAGAAPRPLSWLAGADQNCFLCRAVAETQPEGQRESLIAHSTGKSIVVLNRYPYNNGHLLIAPRRHRATLSDLDADEHLDLMNLLASLCRVLEEKLNAEGFNIGLNLGRVAGAGLPGHLHWHIVPRWNGDTNFMPALAALRVIPQSLEALWELLREALANSRG
jgi:ATP adenylyltransferase